MVIALNWQTHDILLGECKWRAETVDRSIIRDLVAKTPLVLADLPDRGVDWHVHYAIFTRAGVTPAARQELATHHGFLVELAPIPFEYDRASLELKFRLIVQVS